MTVINRTTFQNRCRNAIAGVQKDLKSVTTITLEGVDYTPTTLVALLQSGIKVAMLLSPRGPHGSSRRRNRPRGSSRSWASSRLSRPTSPSSSARCGDTQAHFGFAPRKKAVKTAETKANAAAKARATRAARHTMGSEQKKAITGASTATEPVTPATTPTNPAPAVNPQAPATPKS